MNIVKKYSQQIADQIIEESKEKSLSKSISMSKGLGQPSGILGLGSKEKKADGMQAKLKKSKKSKLSSVKCSDKVIKPGPKVE